MKKLIILPFIFGTTILSAQNQQDSTLIPVINELETRLKQLQSEIERLYSELNKEYRTYRIVKEDLNQAIMITQEKMIDSLNTLIYQSNQKLKIINEQLESKISQTGQNTNNKISALQSSLSLNRLYWIIATLSMLLLGGAIYWMLGKRISSDIADVENQITNTKASLDEKSCLIDEKLLDLIETQLKVKEMELKNQPAQKVDKIDHSLALKVADEIVRLQKNISRMDHGIKGLTPLVKGIERIQANFSANGYEMINLLNSEYDERMNIDVINFVEDGNLETGKRIISKIIKPQVNFNGILIQRAQIEVSQN